MSERQLFLIIVVLFSNLLALSAILAMLYAILVQLRANTPATATDGVWRTYTRKTVTEKQ